MDMVHVEGGEGSEEVAVLDEEGTVVLVVRIGHLGLVGCSPFGVSISPWSAVSVNVPGISHLDQVGYYSSVGVFYLESTKNLVGMITSKAEIRAGGIASNNEVSHHKFL